MSYKVSNIDRTSLPTALLPQAKSQMRVVSTNDDALITSLIARTIDIFERQSGLSIFEADVVWIPDNLDTIDITKGVLIPVQPIKTWAAADGEGTDVTASYQIVGNDTGRATGLYFASKTATLPSGDPTLPTLTMKVGYAAITEIPPATLEAILARTASYYAWREDLSETNVDEIPDFDQTWMVGHWVPRV
jgi:uncharacterized phiE125 gp8 family phage protein